jgi:hypothetical protein
VDVGGGSERRLEKTVVTGLRSCAAHQILFGDRMKEEEMGGACGTRGRERRCIRGVGLVWTLEGKRPLARHSRRWEGNNKIILTELRCEGMEWIHLASEKDKWLAVVSTLRRILSSLQFGVVFMNCSREYSLVPEDCAPCSWASSR